MKKLLEKIRKAFSTTSGRAVVYGREEEKRRIQAFLCGEERALHVTGPPGTGKTCTILGVLEGTEHAYINYYFEPNVSRVLNGLSARIVVIDEFDKYFAEKKSECMKNTIRMSKRGTKLITISNNLRMGHLKFGPYGSKEILCILNEKIAREIGAEIAEKPALAYIAKKFDRCGDMRVLFKFILEAILRKKEDSGGCKLLLGDCTASGTSDSGKNIHHQMISKIAADGVRVSEAYGAYLKECETMGIPVFGRHDFDMVFEMYR